MEKTTLENRIRNTLRARGSSRREADQEAFGYTIAWFKGEVEPETIAAVSGLPIEELRQQARELNEKRRTRK